MNNTTNSNIIIKPVQEKDASSIAKVCKSIGWFDLLNTEPADQTESRIKRHIILCNSDDSHSMYVAQTSQNLIAGYVAAHWLPYLFLRAPEGFVSELFIEKSLQGKGIGTKLLDTVVAEAKNRGCCRLSLITSRSRETYQRGYYPKQGWSERDDMANFVLELKDV